MSKYFHGTSHEAALNILTDGFNALNKNWNYSEDNNVYLWHITNNRNERQSLEAAYLSACKYAAIKNSKMHFITVIEIDTDVDICNDDKINDTLVCVNTDILNRIMSDTCTSKVIHYFNYYPDMRAQYLYADYHNLADIKWDAIIDNIVDIDSLLYDLKYIEDFYPYDYYFSSLYNMDSELKVCD